MSTRRSLRSQRHTQDDERDVANDEHESDHRGENPENVDKEQMIWDAFREEHYEGTLAFCSSEPPLLIVSSD